MKRALLISAVCFSACINFDEEYWKYHPDGGDETGGGSATGGGGGASTTGGGSALGGGAATGGGAVSGGGSATGGGGDTGGGAASGGGSATGGGDTGGGSATGGGSTLGGGTGTGGGGQVVDAGHDVFLTSLSVTPAGALTFDEATLAYAVHVPNGTSSVQINFSAPPEDTITVNSASTTSPFTALLTGPATVVSIRVQAMSGAVRTYVVTVLEQLAQSTYFKASLSTQRFGESVALSGDGNTMVVAAYQEVGGGAAYVFRSDGGAWSQQARLVASNRDNNDFFGTSIAISGDGTTIAVGANGEDSSGNANGPNPTSNTASFSGAVYVFKFTSSWAEEFYLKASNAGAGDQFGTSVSLSDDGNALAIGAPYESSGESQVLPANQQNGDDNTVTSAGSAYLYRRNPTWEPFIYFKPPNPGANDNFGWSVALSGDARTVAVGAIGEDGEDGGFNNVGAVYVFKSADGEIWDDAPPAILRGVTASTYFGESVAIDSSGDTLAVGARGESTTASNSGAGFVYAFDGGTWGAPTMLKAQTPRSGDSLGISIALSRDGRFCAVGSEQESNTGVGVDNQTSSWSASGSGAVFVFARQSDTWVRDGYLKASNAEAGDSFGHSMAISGDGHSIAVCADQEASSALGINGNQSTNDAGYSGAAYLFTR